ncbi:unnamed protein product [Caretta caretta]
MPYSNPNMILLQRAAPAWGGLAGRRPGRLGALSREPLDQPEPAGAGAGCPREMVHCLSSVKSFYTIPKSVYIIKD